VLKQHKALPQIDPKAVVLPHLTQDRLWQFLDNLPMPLPQPADGPETTAQVEAALEGPDEIRPNLAFRADPFKALPLHHPPVLCLSDP